MLIHRRYGRIRDIEIKTPSRPPAFAFVTFDDRRDAEDAVDGRYLDLSHSKTRVDFNYFRNGYKFDGERIRVEYSRGRGERDDRRGRDEGERIKQTPL